MDDLAAQLSRTIGPLRRAMLRAAASTADLPDLTEPQIQVLRSLAHRAPQTSGELAAGLRLARPTVSNVIRAMTANGFITRAPGGDDMRQAFIAATPHALDLLRVYDETSGAILSDILADLDDEARAVLRRALPLLDDVTAALIHRTSTNVGPTSP